ncbi:Cullin repeat-like-containing domain protein [Choanephora cucurbitarum]|nr:Cullin repeat-like-containing domain protein [Choanephora cucurbitarum]
MKSVGSLRKKGFGSTEHFRRKDKNKNASHNVSSPLSTGYIPKAYAMAPSTSTSTTSNALRTTTTPSAPITVDLHRFADENLQPEEFVKRTLGDANEEGIRSFYKSLTDAKHLVGGDLQRNVYRNYTEFVSISKEISNLDADVLSVKEYLNELKSIWESFLAATQTDYPANSTNAESIFASQRKRSELMPNDLKSIHHAQITALWESIEGAQRFIPQAQNRRIVRECVNFFEVNTRTLQQRQAVHLFLLNDCLLLARKRGHKLVADKCWSIDDFSMTDIKDSSGKFLQKKESHKRVEDKMGLLHAYRRLVDDRDDDAGSSRPTSSLGRTVASTSIHHEKEKYLVELADQLEVLIALRQFEKGVVYLENARHIVIGSSSSLPVVKEARNNIDRYTDILSQIISRDLSNTLLTKIQFQRYVNWLLRLDKSEKARQVFLSTRTLIIKKRIRQLVFEGDITTYISELALVVFTLIRNTCEWYRDSFKQNDMASGFVTWVREQTEIYADIYKRQVFGQSNLSCQVIADCFKSTLEHCSMLRKVGLDLKFLLEDLFLENVKETIVSYEKRNMEKIGKFVQNDNFNVVSGQGLGTDVKVTSSVVSFYNLLVKFANDICLLAKLQVKRKSYIHSKDSVTNVFNSSILLWLTVYVN